MARRGFWTLGFVAPIFFAGAVILLGALKPSYSHVYNTISELGEAGSVTAQSASLVFIITGIMITVLVSVSIKGLEEMTGASGLGYSLCSMGS